MRRVRASKDAEDRNIYDNSNSGKFGLPIAIFILALLIRLIYLIQIKSSLPLFSAPIMDELYHDTWAQQIASGDWVGKEAFFRAPLYVYLLALTYKIFGHNLFLPRLFQMVLGSLGCVLIFLIAKKLFNRTVGILSGVIAAFYAMLIFYDGQLLITSLIVFLDLVLIGLLILTAEKPRALNWFFCGIVLGLSAIARPNILVFIPFVLIWMLFRFKNELRTKTVLIRWLILCFAVLLVILPVTLRNYLMSKDFVPIAWQGGYNFYLGNNPNASGWAATAPEIDKSWWGGYQDAIWLAQEETGLKLKPSQISDFWFRKGFGFVFSEPLSWLKLTVRKAIYFWKGFEISNNQNIYLYKDFSSLLNFLLGKLVIYYPFGLLGPLSVLGLLICLKDFRRYLLVYLFILSYSASVIIFFVCSRYRMPVIPFLIMFGSFFLWWLFRKIKERKIFSVLISLFLVALLSLALNTTLEDLIRDQRPLDHFVLGTAYRRLGKMELAVEEWKTSLRYNPQFSRSRVNLATAYSTLGETEKAIEEYNRVLLYDSSLHHAAYYGLARIHHGQGSLERAIEYYLRAIETNPRFEIAHLGLGRAYQEKGLFEKATEEAMRVLELNPDSEEARRLLIGR